jgi:arginase family enzyme
VRRIAVLDAPSNLGLRPPTATSVPGCAKAPGALRDQGLLTKLGARDAGCLTPPRYDPGDWRPGDGVAHAAEIAAYSRALADRIGAIIDGGEFPVVLGGDCSILIGAGIAMHRLGDAVGGRIGLVFVDGHSDFRHPGNASYVGAAAGEDLALVTGRGQADLAAIESRRPYFRDIDVVVLGIRAQDEYRLDLQAAGIVTRPVPALRAEGAARSAQWARDQLVDCAGYWVHVDVDVLDPAVMPAVDAPDPGGIAFPELELLLTGLVESPHCLGVEITVFDPDYDPDSRYASEITSAVVSGLSPVRTTSPRPDLAAVRRDLDKPASRRGPAARRHPAALLRPAEPAPDTDAVAGRVSAASGPGSVASGSVAEIADPAGSDSGGPAPAAEPESAAPASTPASASISPSAPIHEAASTSASALGVGPASASALGAAAASTPTSAAASTPTSVGVSESDVDLDAPAVDGGAVLGRSAVTAISIEIQSSGSPALPDFAAGSETDTSTVASDNSAESVISDFEPDAESSDAVSGRVSVSGRGAVPIASDADEADARGADEADARGADDADDRGADDADDRGADDADARGTVPIARGDDADDDRGAVATVGSADAAVADDVGAASGADAAVGDEHGVFPGADTAVDDHSVVSVASGADSPVPLGADGDSAAVGADAAIAGDREDEAGETDSGLESDGSDPESAVPVDSTVSVDSTVPVESAVTVDALDRRTALSVPAWITARNAGGESADGGFSRSDAEFVLAAALAPADLPGSADGDEADRAGMRHPTARPDESFLANGAGNDHANGAGNGISSAGISDGDTSDVPDGRNLVVLELSSALVSDERDLTEGNSDHTDAGIADLPDAGSPDLAGAGITDFADAGTADLAEAAFADAGTADVADAGISEDAGSGTPAEAGADASDVAEPGDGADPEPVADAEAVGSDGAVEEAEPIADPDEEPRPGRTRTETDGVEVRLLSRPLGSAPLLDSEPLPATRPGMLRPRPPADSSFGPPAAGPGPVAGFPPSVA